MLEGVPVGGGSVFRKKMTQTNYRLLRRDQRRATSSNLEEELN